MKASELIKLLKTGIARFGDCEVEVDTGHSRKSPTTVLRCTNGKRDKLVISTDEEGEYESST